MARFGRSFWGAGLLLQVVDTATRLESAFPIKRERSDAASRQQKLRVKGSTRGEGGFNRRVGICARSDNVRHRAKYPKSILTQQDNRVR
jgi:hypothetical protein